MGDGSGTIQDKFEDNTFGMKAEKSVKEWEEREREKYEHQKSEEKAIREPHPQWINIPGLSFLSSLALGWFPSKQEWCRGSAWRLLYL